MDKGRRIFSAVRELSYHLIKSKKLTELVIDLTDLSFIELKITLGMTYDLFNNYTEATDEEIETYDRMNIVLEYHNFVKSNSWETGRENRIWIRCINL